MTSTVLSGRPEDGADGGPGLWQRTHADGSSVVTNLRLAGTSRKAGSGLINLATFLLGLLGLGLFAVSINAQYTYVFHVKHQHLVSFIEAISLDAGLAIFSLLGLGLARAGKTAKVERALVLVCALASAAMNYAASDVLSPRSVAAYVVPPIFLAVVVDRVIAVVRRHVLGEDEVSPWKPFGRAGIYLLRLIIAPWSTLRGGRQAILNAAPVPERPKAVVEPTVTVPAVVELPERGPVQAIVARPVAAIERPRRTRTKASSKSRTKTAGPSKTSQFLELVASDHGDLSGIDLTKVYGICKGLAPKVGLHEGSARTALRAAILRAKGDA